MGVECHPVRITDMVFKSLSKGNVMNPVSKINQKLVALALLTAALCIPNFFLQDRDASFAAEISHVDVGQKAPDFAIKDIKGKTWKLKDHLGKVIVLEWFNFGCPFVKKHYESGNMQKLQEAYEKKGVLWVCINSSAPGKQGHATSAEYVQAFEDKKSAPNAVLVDTDGNVGRLYGAKTTPHMFVIGKDGKIVYQGAIDDKRGTEQSEIASAKNYVKSALDETLAGKPVTESETKPYGCSVKY